MIICCNGAWERGDYLTEDDFARDIHILKRDILSRDYSKCVLQMQDLYRFAVSFFAVLQAKKTLLLTSNAQPGFLKEICDSQTLHLTEDLYKKICSEANAENPPKDLNIEPDAEIILYTSGTTGEPKGVHKFFHQLSAECEVLAEFLGEQKNILFCRTVSHYHIYGLLFSFLLPVRLGCPFRRDLLEFPESLNSLNGKKTALVSSAAFLKRIRAEDYSDSSITAIFCSGGVLHREVAENASKILGAWPVEIYGSTETGGIAHRCSKNGLEWQPFPVCKLSIADNACLRVKSPYIANSDGFVTGDLAEFLDNGKFLLSGRADSIVKIEEKRISLAEVEKRIRASGLVHEVVVALVDSSSRQCLGAALVLNEQGEKKFRDFTAMQKNSYFRNYLSDFLEGVTIPRKWRYLKSLPQDSQGKIKAGDIKKLFEDCRKATVNFSVPASSDYFNGHFEKFPLLPAVVQVDIAIRQAALHFGSSLCLNRILKTKFMKPILPEKPLRLELVYTDSENKLVFDFFDAENNAPYSSGTIFLDADK
ncbi:MAG: AMP-binding protein [Candidatus Fibromonas sp.]|jgi:acyl-coenzyme A synthetase/AMP-(fatty) acid ligase|nr:AMP-binding protein [Candidatus Fibromonas sp.]